MRVCDCVTASDLEALGACLADATQAPLTIFLSGPLGAGKTTLARGLIRSKGYRGAVKSPTFTLVESYRGGSCTIYHLDLYRISDAGELELAGIRDYFADAAIRLIEWPERATHFLGEPDLRVDIAVLDGARRVRLNAHSMLGTVSLDRFRLRGC